MSLPTWRILVGDVRKRLAELEEESVHCIVTSFPYWALRDYGVEGQIGLEASPEEFYAAMVEVGRELRRVLRKDGVMWANHGDCYYSSRSFSGSGEDTDGMFLRKHEACGNVAGKSLPKHPKLKQKDLVGQAWGVAFALRDDGWWLRSGCVWHKPNPLPESAPDRPSSGHEFVFMLTKSGKGYFYDREAVRTPFAATTLTQKSYGGEATKDYASSRAQDPAKTKRSVIASLEKNSGALLKTVWAADADPAPMATLAEEFAAEHADAFHAWVQERRGDLSSVWTIPTQPFAGAHFATFPERLVERCVKAATSERGCCSTCGKPWRRLFAPATGGSIGKAWHDHGADGERGNAKRESSDGYVPPRPIGWERACEHDGEPMPCVVLDPFSGSGTTVAVALRMGRSAIGIELNPEYAQMAAKRVRELSPTLARQGAVS